MAFLADITGGFTFRRVSSPIHRLDPRSKLALVAAFSVAAMLFTRFVQMLVLFAFLVPLLLVAKVHRLWLRSARWLILFAAFIFAVNVLVSGSLDLALAFALRFVTLTTAFSLFFLTTLPDELGLMLEKMRVPYDISFAFVSAVRFVPVMAVETAQILDSHRARGFELAKGGPLTRIKRYVPVIVTIIVNAIKRSNELAECLESRAFGAKAKRVNLYDLRMRPRDYLCLLLAVAMGIAAYLASSY